MGAWLDGRHLDSVVLEAALRPGRERRSEEVPGGLTPFFRFGCACNVVFGMLFFFGLGGPTSLTEATQIPLAITTVWRLSVTWRLLPFVAASPVLLLGLAWFAWAAISTLWSPNPSGWIDDAHGVRFAWLLLGVYPILHLRKWLIASLVLGFLAGNFGQLLHALQVNGVIDGMLWQRDPQRLSGWWDPVVGGSLLVTVLGLHASVAVLGRGWSKPRVLAIGATAITGIGLIATGTRGAWIAGAFVLLLIAFCWVVRGPRRITKTAVCAVAIIVVGGALWFGAGDSVRARADRAASEVRSAMIDGNFASDTGSRLAMWSLAARAFGEHPVRGVGAGGYQTWAQGRLIEEQPDTGINIHDHAHGSVFHLLATQGLIGGGIALALVVVAVRTASRSRPLALAGTYAGAVPFAMVALLMTGLTDTTQTNMQTAAMFWALCALTPRLRPSERPFADSFFSR